DKKGMRKACRGVLASFFLGRLDSIQHVETMSFRDDKFKRRIQWQRQLLTMHGVDRISTVGSWWNRREKRIYLASVDVVYEGKSFLPPGFGMVTGTDHWLALDKDLSYGLFATIVHSSHSEGGKKEVQTTRDRDSAGKKEKKNKKARAEGHESG
ncbi:unnamed protein product, partial [marine sediment metagenome]